MRLVKDYKEAVGNYQKVREAYIKDTGRKDLTVRMYETYMSKEKHNISNIAGQILQRLMGYYKIDEIKMMDNKEEFDFVYKNCQLENILMVLENWHPRFEEKISIVENYVKIFGAYDEKLFESNAAALLKERFALKESEWVKRIISDNPTLTGEKLNCFIQFFEGLSVVGRELGEYLLEQGKLEYFFEVNNRKWKHYRKAFDALIIHKIRMDYFDNKKSIVEQCFAESQHNTIDFIEGKPFAEEVFFKAFNLGEKKLIAELCRFIDSKGEELDCFDCEKEKVFVAFSKMIEKNIRRENIRFALENAKNLVSLDRMDHLESSIRNDEDGILCNTLWNDEDLSFIRLNGIETYMKNRLANKYGITIGLKAKRAPYSPITKSFEIGESPTGSIHIGEDSPYFEQLVLAMGEEYANEKFKKVNHQWMQKYLEAVNFSVFSQIQKGDVLMLRAAFENREEILKETGSLCERIEAICIGEESELKQSLQLSDEFMDKNRERIVQFSMAGGLEIYRRLSARYEDKLRINLGKIVKAALSEPKIYKHFKYTNLENEIEYRLNKSQKEAWKENGAKIYKVEMNGQISDVEVAEKDDFMDIIQLGTTPQRTCQSWREGSMNQSLLSNFDGNKKVLYAYNQNGTCIARSIVRLAKIKNPGGTLEIGKKLSFVDVTKERVEEVKPSVEFAQLDLFGIEQEQVEEENVEQLAIFLERIYSPYNERDELLGCFADYVKSKAKELNAVALSYQSVEGSEKICTDFYISETQNGIQYLDSFAGATTLYGYQRNCSLNKL